MANNKGKLCDKSRRDQASRFNTSARMLPRQPAIKGGDHTSHSRLAIGQLLVAVVTLACPISACTSEAPSENCLNCADDSQTVSPEPRILVRVGPWELRNKQTAVVYPDLGLPDDITCAVVALDPGPVKVESISAWAYDEPPWRRPQGVQIQCLAPDHSTDCAEYTGWSILGMRPGLQTGQPFFVRHMLPKNRAGYRQKFEIKLDRGESFYFSVELNQ